MYPLWLCPFKLYNLPGMIHPQDASDEMYVDIGAYGAPKTKQYEAKRTTRKLEAYVSRVNGLV